MRFFAVSDFGLEVADLSVNIEPKTGRAFEFKDLSARTPVVLGTVADAVFEFRISVEFSVGNALDSLHGSRFLVVRRWSAVEASLATDQETASDEEDEESGRVRGHASPCHATGGVAVDQR